METDYEIYMYMPINYNSNLLTHYVTETSGNGNYLFSSRKDSYTNSSKDTGSSGVFGNTLPSSSVFTIGDASETGKSEDYVAYCWHNVEGFSKFGSFEGNSDADGPFG